MLRHVTRVSALCLTFALAACDESLASLTGPTPQLKPTFSSIQTEIFENGDSSGRPACISCHNAAGQFFNGLNLTHAVAYTNLVNVASGQCAATKRVLPGNASMSYLMWKLQGTGPCFVGTRMPKGQPLAAADLNTISTWIAAGAPNN